MFFTDHTIRHQRDLVHVEAQVSILIGLPGFSEVLNKHKKNRTNKQKVNKSAALCFTCVGLYRIAVTVFVEIPGSVKTPLHLWSRLWRIHQLTDESKTRDDYKGKIHQK